jgi:hypothetical protein
MTATVYEYQVRTGSRLIRALSFTGGDGRTVFGVVEAPATASFYSRPGSTVRKLRVPKFDLNTYDCVLLDAAEAVEAAKGGLYRLAWTPYKVGA